MAHPLRLWGAFGRVLRGHITSHNARPPTRWRLGMKLYTFVRDFLRKEDGQDLIEYALLVALISLVCVVALTAAGSQVNTIFNNIKTRLTTAASNT
jgi:pilus assembly protein Flp/PilA